MPTYVNGAAVFTDQELEDLRVAREAACASARASRAHLPREGDVLDPNVVYIRLRDGYLLPIGD